MKQISIGTDCSGIEAPIHAMNKIVKSYTHLSYDHVFSSEIDPYAVQIIQANYEPTILYGDMKERDITTIPNIDMYVSGFPCQPYSIANKYKKPVDPRINLFQNCLDVIFHKRPSCFLLENVITLVTLNQGKYFNEIINQLERDDIYHIYWMKMNSKDYGIPQSRKRVYIIGVRKDVCKKEFQFPKQKKMMSLKQCIDKSDTTKHPIKEANTHLFSIIPKDSIFIDVGFRNCSFPNSGKWSPCLCAQPNLWNVAMGRKASVKEYLMLQGFPTDLKQPVSPHQMKKKIGNSMTVDVIELLMIEIFRSLEWL
jgi:DNA (cytosine-5)-methyltransferase 1